MLKQQTMTKEQILEKHSTKLTDGTCICSKKSRLKAMQEYAKQEVAKEREKAKKLVEALEEISDMTGNILIYKKAKQSLTEYEK